MEALGCPRLGDNKYYGTERIRLKEVADKLYLQAYKVDLSVIYGKKMEIKAEWPQHFAETCKFFGLEKE